MSRPPIPAEAFEHGDPKRYRRGCRCCRCTKGVTAEVRRARYLRNTGRGLQTAPDKAAAQILRLRAAGMQDRDIRAQAAIADDVLYRILRGEGGILRSTERRVLAVTPTGGHGKGSGAQTAGLGTIRRLRALAADGWTAAEIADRVGKHKQFIVHLQNSKLDARLRGWVADYVSNLYADVDGMSPEEAGIAPHIVGRTRARAAKKGWIGRAYWDPEDFDDPDFAPAVTTAPRYIVLAENCLELEAHGLTRQQIADRHGITKNHLETAISRYRKTGQLAQAA
ncbi:hypothetical protein AB0L83_21820 [Streptomyces sp. NPDC052071]|uniref:hypothetical protein n=1 Tax=Streptomyces sp. NPDC052071 TaxID=3156666 RepID=UPI003423A6B3